MVNYMYSRRRQVSVVLHYLVDYSVYVDRHCFSSRDVMKDKQVIFSFLYVFLSSRSLSCITMERAHNIVAKCGQRNAQSAPFVMLEILLRRGWRMTVLAKCWLAPTSQVILFMFSF